MKNLSSKEKAMLCMLANFASHSVEFKKHVDLLNTLLSSVTTDEIEFRKDLKKACKKFNFKFKIIE
jgi:hypothetical protein